MPTSPRVLFRLPLVLILLLTLAAALVVPGNRGSLALANPANSEAEAPTEFVTTDDPADPDEGDLCFLYTGDGMAEPDRRDFPVQPEFAPDLPFTVSETIAVSTAGGDPDAPTTLGYIWRIENAEVDTDNSNAIFSFGGYAITHQPYLDIKVKGDLPGEKRIEATMFTIVSDDVDPDTPFRAGQAKKGKTKVIIGAQSTPLAPGDIGYVQLNATPSVIGIGEHSSLSARLLTPELALDPASGVPITVDTPVARPTTDSVDGQAAFPPTYTPPAAGLYPLGAQAPDYTSADPKMLVVVEVIDLIADRGTHVPSSATGDVPCVFVTIDPAHPTVTVSAVPNIAMPDNKLPSSWSLTKGENGQPVPYSGGHPDDTRQCLTLDALTAGEHLIVAKCGTSIRKLCVVIAEDGEHWRPGDAPYIFPDGMIDAGGSAAPPGSLIVIPEGSHIDLLAIAVDFDHHYDGSTFQEEDPDVRSVIWDLSGDGGSLLFNNEILAPPVRVMQYTTVRFQAPTLNPDEPFRDIDLTATPDDNTTENPGNLPEGELGNRNDEPGEPVTVTIRVVPVGTGPTSIDQVAAIRGDWSSFFFSVMDHFAGTPVGDHWNGTVLKLLGAERFEMHVSREGAEPGALNGYFVIEHSEVHPNNSDGTFDPIGESDTSNFSALRGNINWGWGDIIANSGQGFIVGLGTPPYRELITGDLVEYVLPGSDPKNDTFFDYYIMENRAFNDQDRTALTNNDMDSAYMYGRHTYSYGDEALGVFRATFTFTNRTTPGGFPYTHVTVDRQAE